MPETLLDIVETMMCKDPDQRMQNCEDVQAALGHFLSTEEIPDTVTLIESDAGDSSKQNKANSDVKEAASASTNKSIKMGTIEIDTSARKRKPKSKSRSKSAASKNKLSDNSQTPAWILPTIIGGMFLALAVVFAIVVYLTQ